MLVADGHLEAIEPAGWAGLANRLAGTPGKFLTGHLQRAREHLARTPHRARGAPSFDSVAACEKIDAVLAMGARPRWSPRRHLSYPVGFRDQVRALLLCAQRHGAAADAPAEASSVDPQAPLGRLPKEVVLLLVEALAETTMWAYEGRDGPTEVWQRGGAQPLPQLVS